MKAARKKITVEEKEGSPREEVTGDMKEVEYQQEERKTCSDLMQNRSSWRYDDMLTWYFLFFFEAQHICVPMKPMGL